MQPTRYSETQKNVKSTIHSVLLPDDSAVLEAVDNDSADLRIFSPSSEEGHVAEVHKTSSLTSETFSVAGCEGVRDRRGEHPRERILDELRKKNRRNHRSM